MPFYPNYLCYSRPETERPAMCSFFLECVQYAEHIYESLYTSNDISKRRKLTFPKRLTSEGSLFLFFRSRAGIFQEKPVERGQLPVSQAEELRRRPCEQEPMPVLPATKVSRIRDVSRWFVPGDPAPLLHSPFLFCTCIFPQVTAQRFAGQSSWREVCTVLPRSDKHDIGTFFTSYLNSLVLYIKFPG